MFNKIRQDVYSVFGSTMWQNTDCGCGFVQAYPENYIGDKTEVPYIVFSIVPGKASTLSYRNRKEINGLLIASIFVSAKRGDYDAYRVAEKLDSFFQGVTLANKTTFTNSYVVPRGLDQDDPQIYRVDYYINFTNYGE